MKQLDELTTRKITWMIVGAGAAMLASSAVEKSLAAGWRAATSKEPPEKTDLPGRSDWTEVLAWTAASAVAIGLSRVMAKRGAALGWEFATGKEPPA